MRVLILLLLLFVPLDLDDKIAAKDARTHAGKTAIVCGKVAQVRHADRLKGAPTFLNFDQAYPDQSFTALIWGTDRAKFDPAPETFEGKRVCVRGLVAIYKGKPQTVLKRSEQIEAQ